MKKPKEWDPIEIEIWREKEEMKRRRREIMGVESYGRDIEALEDNERR